MLSKRNVHHDHPARHCLKRVDQGTSMIITETCVIILRKLHFVFLKYDIAQNKRNSCKPGRNRCCEENGKNSFKENFLKKIEIFRFCPIRLDSCFDGQRGSGAFTSKQETLFSNLEQKIADVNVVTTLILSRRSWIILRGYMTSQIK